MTLDRSCVVRKSISWLRNGKLSSLIQNIIVCHALSIMSIVNQSMVWIAVDLYRQVSWKGMSIALQWWRNGVLLSGRSQAVNVVGVAERVPWKLLDITCTLQEVQKLSLQCEGYTCISLVSAILCCNEHVWYYDISEQYVAVCACPSPYFGLKLWLWT